MRTSDPDIFAVGDAVEVKDFITGQWSLIALAGPANRQGRIAADVIAGRDSSYRGTQGSWVCGVFGLAAAATGASEKLLLRLGEGDLEKIYIFPSSHAGYYPDAKVLSMKVIFRKSDGRLLGAQVVGEDGAEKRVDAIAVAIQMGGTVYDLEEAELCYAPQFGSAKAPVNFAGMVAADVLRGDMPLGHWSPDDSAFLLDVRRPEELGQGADAGRGQHPVGRDPRAPRRAAPRPRDPRPLLLRSALVLRDSYPVAERVQGAQRLRRHAVTLGTAWGMRRREVSTVMRGVCP